ncbi:AfsR/SARP family transcriptional regulator [Micromonospora sp. NBC_01796]|uniref:AfsR/SARP family transcriptional regulator n=1 Tax=Micromonospora sp. NBC_01796 TaxID=2975987 RepID=UPI002DD990EC|nr:BTAD domain-containing putative transcriptional regulator [Micromonospora sp. NBC_01796]WSA85664.1 NB-ARC domain-containing protein [Micromonospora sp. NBC_01796]
MLGPLSVNRADGPVDLHHGHKPMLLLAILLARAPQVVSVDELLIGVWGDRPPRSARPNIHQYVHRLRLALGPERICRHPSGYALQIADHEFDAARFRALAARAKVDLGDARTEEANLSLRSALDLWRGPAFDGFLDCELVAAEATRLEQQRWSVRERWTETELALGRHREMVDVLSELVDAQPYRELPRAQLMLALHRSGRRLDALDLYRRTRNLFVTDLGVEPGEALRLLHQRILVGTPTAGGGAIGKSQNLGTLNQLPPLSVSFVGRVAERAQLVEALMAGSATSPAVIGISGLGGLGKTSIAVWAAHSVLDAYPDGCVFADLRGTDTRPPSHHAVLGALLRALGIQGTELPQGRTARLGLFRAMTANRRLLIVLDNADNEAQVRPLIPGGPGCGVIVTSRRFLAGLERTHTLELDPLTDSESAELLRTHASPHAIADSTGVADLIRWCGGLPLAIRIVAGRLRSRNALSPSHLVRLLQGAGNPVDELHLGDLNIRSTFMLSYRRLGPAAATLLAHLGRLGYARFTLDTCLPLVDETHGRVLDALAELDHAGLITGEHPARAIGAARYRMHDLVRSFAAAQAPTGSGDAYRGALKRLTSHYIARLCSSRDFVHGGSLHHLPIVVPPSRPFPDEAAALDWLDAEVDNILAAMPAIGEAGLHEEVWQVAYLLRPYLRLRHRSDDRHTVGRAGVESARLIGNQLAEALLLECLATAHHDDDLKNPSAKLHYEQARQLFRAVGSNIGVATCEDQLGTYYQNIGELELSEQHHRRALAVPEYTSDPGNGCRSHISLGTLYGRQERYPDAEREFTTALTLAMDAHDQYIACFAHHNLAYLYRLQGRRDEALLHAHAEIELAVFIRNKLREARARELLGDIHGEHDPNSATTAWQRAVELYEQLGSDRADEVRSRMQSTG